MTTMLWEGETTQTARWTSNPYEWWNWYGGSTPRSVDVRIDIETGEPTSKILPLALDTKRVYNKSKNSLRNKVTFETSLVANCELQVKAGSSIDSGIKTYVNFPFSKKDGSFEGRGKRLADFNTGEQVRKEWSLEASADTVVPPGYTVDF